MQAKIIVLAWLGVCAFAGTAENSARSWVGSWAAAPVGWSTRGGPPSQADSTYRNVVHITVGGVGVRVKLTNEFGATPLKIGAAHIAMSAGGGNGAIQIQTDHPLTFGGRPTVTIPAGALVLSDPVEMEVPASSSLDVSVYLPDQPVPESTCHPKAWSTNFLSKGDTTGASAQQGAARVESWCYVKEVEVRGTPKNRVIVALGDSITDGGHATIDQNHRWPDFLAGRLLAKKKTARFSVLNEGIGGNRILNGGSSNPSALARFDRDVLAHGAVKYLVILEGINDIAHNGDKQVSADYIIFGLNQLISRAREHGISVFGATITPFKGAKGFSAAKEQERQVVNEWMRTSGSFDGVIDFDKVVRDPADPSRLLPVFDHDHIHPSDAGYKAMAGAINLQWFR
jgi:lysophospholipase L1-like esterase